MYLLKYRKGGKCNKSKNKNDNFTDVYLNKLTTDNFVTE